MLENIYSYFFTNNSESNLENHENDEKSTKEEWILVLNDDKITSDNDCLDNYSLDIYIDEPKNKNSYKYIDTISSRIGNAVLHEKECSKAETKYYPIYVNNKPPTSKQLTLYFHQDPINEVIDQSYLYHILNKKNSQWSPIVKEPIFKMLKQFEWKDKYDNSKIDVIVKENVTLKYDAQIN